MCLCWGKLSSCLALLRQTLYLVVMHISLASCSLHRDLDEDTYASWCSKITLRGFKPGDYICKHGQDSRYAYIVVYGLVQEVDGHLHSTEVYSPGSGEASSASSIHTIMTPLHEGAKDSSLPASLPPLQTSAEPSLEAPVRYLGPGSLFGEVPLVTDSPYFSTVQAAGTFPPYLSLPLLRCCFANGFLCLHSTAVYVVDSSHGAGMHQQAHAGPGLQ